MGSWDFKSNKIYGQIPDASGGTRVSLSATMGRSSRLTPGFYEMYAITSQGTGMVCWVKGGNEAVNAATIVDFYIPADSTYIFEVHGGVNDYVAAIARGAWQGSLCIMTKQDAFDRR